MHLAGTTGDSVNVAERWVAARVGPHNKLGRTLRLANLAFGQKRAHDVLHREALRRGPIRFVQIGSNDGDLADPLRPFIEDFCWSGVMVEPQPFVFAEKLVPLYGSSPRIHLVNAAIGPKSGSMALHVISFSTDRWATGKASLDRRVLERAVESGLVERLAAEHGVIPPPDKGTWISSIEVPMITARELIESSEITDFDLLHVDTEGSDAMILRQFDFDRLSTSIVLFEHRHLDGEALASACTHLSASGFQLNYDRMDVLAVRGFSVGRTSMRPLDSPWAIGR